MEKYDKDFRQRHPKSPEQKLHRTIFDGIRRGCKNLDHNKDQSSLETVGLESWDKFREYIESQFTEGMNWDNYGNKNQNWSINHTY